MKLLRYGPAGAEKPGLLDEQGRVRDLSEHVGDIAGDVLTPARAHYKGVLVGNMGYTPQEAANAIESGQLDAVAFGTAFLANPDLPARIKAGASLNSPNPATFYSPGPEGYTDYPFMQ